MSSTATFTPAAPTPLSLQKQPLEILLPSPSSKPTLHAVGLLADLVKQIIGSGRDNRARTGEEGGVEEVFSVTFSPVPCPAPGTKNDLFVLSPHWWRTASGEWEWRDGQRNPECARPQGQVQLQEMAKTVHTLALGSAHLKDEDIKVQCLKKIEKLLEAFFLLTETRMNPEVWFAQCDPSQDPLRGNAQFVVAVRHLILVGQTLLLIQDRLDQDIVSGVKAWLTQQVEWMKTSPQGFEARERVKPLWYHAVLASHLSALHLDEGQDYAWTTLGAYIAKNPTAFSVFEEPMHHDNRRHRCLFTIEPLFILASIALQRPTSTSTTDAQEDAKEQKQILSWLADCVTFLRGVIKGPIETPREDDQRFFAKIEWFDRLLMSFKRDASANNDLTAANAPGGNKGEMDEAEADGRKEPNGDGWEDGWDQRMRMLWGFI
ncbi:hypothetical protein IAT40_003392 [Kwoniella sp. CBS 6097]